MTHLHNATSCSYCCFGIIMVCCIYHCSQNYNTQQNANSFWDQATFGKKSTTWALSSRSFFCKNSYIWSIVQLGTTACTTFTKQPCNTQLSMDFPWRFPIYFHGSCEEEAPIGLCHITLIYVNLSKSKCITETLFVPALHINTHKQHFSLHFCQRK